MQWTPCCPLLHVALSPCCIASWAVTVDWAVKSDVIWLSLQLLAHLQHLLCDGSRSGGFFFFTLQQLFRAVSFQATLCFSSAQNARKLQSFLQICPYQMARLKFHSPNSVFKPLFLQILPPLFVPLCFLADLLTFLLRAKRKLSRTFFFFQATISHHSTDRSIKIKFIW